MRPWRESQRSRPTRGEDPDRGAELALGRIEPEHAPARERGQPLKASEITRHVAHQGPAGTPSSQRKAALDPAQVRQHDRAEGDSAAMAGTRMCESSDKSPIVMPAKMSHAGRASSHMMRRTISVDLRAGRLDDHVAYFADSERI